MGLYTKLNVSCTKDTGIVIFMYILESLFTTTTQTANVNEWFIQCILELTSEMLSLPPGGSLTL